MKSVLVILQCSINNQSRVINFITTLSVNNKVLLYYKSKGDDDESERLFSRNVELYPYKRKNNIISKILRHTFFWLEHAYLINNILRDHRHKHFDIILCHDLPVLFPAIKLSKHFKSKLVYDSLEIYNETINQFFPGQNKGLKSIISKFLIRFMKFNGETAECYMVKKTDAFITVNQSIARYFENKYNVNKVYSVMNCHKLHIDKPTPRIDFIKMFNSPQNTTVFLYQGVLNEGRGLMMLLKAFEIIKLKYDTIKLAIIGKGVLKEQMQNYIIEKNLSETISIIDFVPYNELIHYTSSANFGINLLEPLNLSKKLASPNKLFEYMQAEIPVLCSYSPENDIIFSKYNIGIQCLNTVDSIVDGIIRLFLSDDNQINAYTTDLQKSKLEYNWENQEIQLHNIFEKL